MNKTTLLIFASLLLVTGRVSAVDDAVTESSQEELVEVQTEIVTTSEDAKRLEAEKHHALTKLKILEKSYGETINSVLGLKTEIEQQQQSLQSLKDQIQANQNAINTEKQGLEGLIKSAYAMGDKERLKVILNQQDPAISSRMLVYYDYLNQERLAKLRNIQQAFANLRQLEANKTTESQLLQVSLDKKQQDLKAIEALKKDREKLVRRLEKQYAVKVEQLEQLVTSEEKLKTVIGSLQKSGDEAIVLAANSLGFSNQPLATQQGQLPWPVDGKITYKFGSQRFDSTWDGVVIDAKEGASIRAISSGQVVYADWLRGYGLMLIIDHGQGYMTLYAFNQSLHKAVGEPVKAGDVIASVGKSGGRSQAALYFGIRKRGRAVDPELWCRKTGKLTR